MEFGHFLTLFPTNTKLLACMSVVFALFFFKGLSHKKPLLFVTLSCFGYFKYYSGQVYLIVPTSLQIVFADLTIRE